MIKYLNKMSTLYDMTLNNNLNKLILLLFTAFMFIPKGYSQINADPGIAILMGSPSVSQGSTEILMATVGNYGNETIVENSLRVTISVGANSEIIGIATGSDTRWNQLSLTIGSANTIVLTNSGGGFDSFNVGDILLTVRGNVMSDPDVVLGNIVYIAAQNPAICPSCAFPPLNASQGNISNSNDNATTSLAVTCYSGLEPNAGNDGVISICEGDDKPTEAELFTALTLADTGGTWSGPIATVYTYTVTSECTSETDRSIVTVTEGTSPNAGSGGEISKCEGAAQPTDVELYATLTDADAGGTWSGPVAGVYTYTVTAIGTCGIDSTAKVKVIVEQPAEPTTECYEIATFDNDNCIWIVSGIQPEVPITACYQKAMFDKVKCEWYLTGTRPSMPTTSLVTQPTSEKATGSFIITNYDESYNYVVSPMTGVNISGDTVTAPEGTYTITAGILVSGPHSETEDCTCLGSASITINAQVKCKPKLTVTLAQNPTLDCFVLLIDSMTREDLCIRIIDPYGKMIDEFILPYKDIISLENRLSGSLYFIEVRQGEERVILKALRL